MTRVLVVDDDETILELVRRRLEAQGCEVHTSSEAIGTSKRVRELKPDVVILDQQMPALSGANVAKVLREVEGDAPKLLLFSSLPDDELAELAEKAGADGWLCKAEGMEALGRKVRELLK